MNIDLRILYVDDDDDIRSIVEMSLALDTAIDARMVSSGQQAIALITDATWRPDVIVLDVMMPELTGPETLEKLRTMTDVPVIFMTARARDADLAQYRQLGAAGVITKPFDPMQLANEIRTLIGSPDQPH